MSGWPVPTLPGGRADPRATPRCPSGSPTPMSPACSCPGSRVDVVTPGPDGDRPVVLAADAAVLTVVAAESGALRPGVRGRLVLVTLPRADAARVAAAALSDQVTVTLR